MKKTYKTEALAAIHETVADLSESGLVDKRTLRRFDDLCLTPIQSLTADQIRAIRTANKVSQAVFARYMNVSVGIVSQWERGEKSPSGATLKLLTIIQRKGLEAIA